MKYKAYILARLREGKKGARVTLHQRLYYAGKQFQYPLNISIAASDYDNKRYVVKGDGAERYNFIITQSQDIIHNIMARYEFIEHKTPTHNDVIEEYVRTMKEKGLTSVKANEIIERTLENTLDTFIEDGKRSKGWTSGTTQKFYTLQDDFKAYREDTGTTLTFENISIDKLYRFMDFLRDRRDLLNTTLNKKSGFIRWYLGWASRTGIYKGNLHKEFMPKYKGSNFEHRNIIYLTEEELKMLEEYEFGKGQLHLAQVRDVFLFACYSGLRFSDVQKLSPYQIHDDVIDIVTKKTNDRLTINLNKHTRKLIEKYKDWSAISGKVLPTISNQKTNDYLHELCRVCKVDTPTSQIYYRGEKMEEVVLPKYEYITFHASRRTFITQAMRLGIPTEVIMKFSGHHRIEMLKPYMKIVDELKKKEMAKFDSM